jgi:hypothetical protein
VGNELTKRAYKGIEPWEMIYCAKGTPRMQAERKAEARDAVCLVCVYGGEKVKRNRASPGNTRGYEGIRGCIYSIRYSNLKRNLYYSPGSEREI